MCQYYTEKCAFTQCRDKKYNGEYIQHIVMVKDVSRCRRALERDTRCERNSRNVLTCKPDKIPHVVPGICPVCDQNTGINVHHWHLGKDVTVNSFCNASTWLTTVFFFVLWVNRCALSQLNKGNDQISGETDDGTLPLILLVSRDATHCFLRPSRFDWLIFSSFSYEI